MLNFYKDFQQFVKVFSLYVFTKTQYENQPNANNVTLIMHEF